MSGPTLPIRTVLIIVGAGAIVAFGISWALFSGGWRLTEIGPAGPVLEPPTQPAITIGSTPDVPVATPYTPPVAVLVARVTLYGNQQNGKQFVAAQAGTYRFTYVDGAYAQGPVGDILAQGKNPYLTGFVIFNGEHPDFGGVTEWSNGTTQPYLNRSTALVWAVDNGYIATVVEAKAAALSAPSVELELVAGQTITIVCIEARDYYFDNNGSVTIDISYLS